MKIKTLLKTIVLSSLTLCCGLSFACCNSGEGNTNETTGAATSVTLPSVNPLVKHDTENKVGYQLEMPEEGDTIAILHTSMGDITWRFFPERASTTTQFSTV